VQRLFRAHAHLAFGLEVGDGKEGGWRRGAAGYPLVGHATARAARACGAADEPWESLRAEMPSGVQSGSTK
jgi:hypothetical protein